MFPPGSDSQAPLGGAAGMLAGLTMRSPMMQSAPMQLRPVPGQDQAENPFYAALAAGDKTAEQTFRKVYQDVRQASLEGRSLLEKSWWEKLLYVNDRQWIVYTARNGWVDKRLERWIPRPVTNICAPTVETIRAMLSGSQPSARCRPNGPDPINATTAGIVDQLGPVMQEEHEMARVYFEADWWAPTLGCLWLHPHWDRDDVTNKEFVQAMQCPSCQYLAHPLDLAPQGDLEACPQCGGETAAFRLAEDAGGKVGSWEVIGKGVTDVVTPLEILIPTYFQRWPDVTELIRLRWRPINYYDGRPYRNEIRGTTQPQDNSLAMYRSLATMTGATKGVAAGTQIQQSKVEGVVEAELWKKPSAEYPQGLWGRLVGGTNGNAFLINDPERGIVPGPLPYVDRVEKKPLWPWAYYPYRYSGGKLFPEGALLGLIQKQNAINRNDSMVELAMQRMANPIWLEPKGAEVQRLTGEPGIVVRYSTVAGTTAKPERLEGLNPPQAFFTLRAQHFEDAERLAGTRDVLKGQTPTGVEAFSALNLLVEQSQKGFTSLFKQRGEAHRVCFELQVLLERSYGPQTRIRAVAGKNNNYTFLTFNRQQLDGSVSIIIEDGSETPKTALGRRAAYSDANNLGVFKMPPAQQYKALDQLGIPDAAPALDVHTRAAINEQEQYLDWVKGGRTGNKGVNPLRVDAWQNHPIHIEQLDLWANSDEIRQMTLLDPDVSQDILKHRVEHVAATTNIFGIPTGQAGMAPGAGAPMGARPPGPGGSAPAPAGPQPPQPVGADRAMMNSNRESGHPDTLPGHPNNNGAGNMGAPA
jgi:ssDNA-binding Zn-finger/Zn-ribbon topoisomerase 1